MKIYVDKISFKLKHGIRQRYNKFRQSRDSNVMAAKKTKKLSPCITQDHAFVIAAS